MTLRLLNRRVDLVLVTSTRAVPAQNPAKDVAVGLEAYLHVDPRKSFHVWVDGNGLGILPGRDVDEIVVPDGLNGPGIAYRALIICVDGWYSAHRAPALGEPFLRGSSAPGHEAASVEHQLRQALDDACREHGLSRADVLLLSEVGSPAYPGDAIERVVRAWRGDEDPYCPENAYFVAAMGPPLDSVEDWRQALRVLGLKPAVTGAWDAHDQNALVAFQARKRLTITGYVDAVTKATLREALREAKLAGAKTREPSDEVSPEALQRLLEQLQAAEQGIATLTSASELDGAPEAAERP